MAAPGLLKNPKFLRYARTIRTSVPTAWGHLECLWMVLHERGSAFVGSADDVELFAQWDGEPGLLFRALRDAGGPGRAGLIEAVEGEADSWMVHDFEDHAPGWVRDRVRKRDQRIREKINRDTSASVTDASGAVGDASVTKPAASDTRPYQTIPRKVAAQPATPSPAPMTINGTPALFGDAGDPAERAERNSDHPTLVAYWCSQWAMAYGGQKYVFLKKDAAHIATILRAAELNLTAAKKIVDRYLADCNPFISDQKHALGLLVSSVNKFTTEPAKNGAKNGNRQSPYDATGVRAGECPERSRTDALLERGRTA